MQRSRRIRDGRIVGAVALLLASVVQLGHAEEPRSLLRSLIAAVAGHDTASAAQSFERLPSQPMASTDGPTVDLSNVSTPFGLEKKLRPIASRSASDMAMKIPNGTARVGNYSIGSDQKLAGHLLVMRGNADVYGTLSGNLVTYAGDVNLHPGAHVDGNVLALRGIVVNDGGVVGGKVQQVSDAALALPPPVALSPALATARNLAGVVGVLLSMLLLGITVVTYGRQNLEIVSDTVVFSFARAFMVGVLAQVIALPTFGMLVVGLTLTVVGVLLVPFAAVAFALLLIVGIVGGSLAVLHAMGETRVRRKLAQGLNETINSYRYLQLGFIVPAALWLSWAMFSQVPIAGIIMLGVAGLTTWCIATLGLGATLLSRAGIRANFAGRVIPAEALTDEYLWATPQFGVPAVSRSEAETKRGSGVL